MSRSEEKKPEENKKPVVTRRKALSKMATAAIGAGAVIVVGGVAYYLSSQPPPQPTPTTTAATTTAPVVTTTVPATTAPATKAPVQLRVTSIQDPFWFSLQLITARGDFKQKTGNIDATVEGVAYDKLHSETVNSFLTKKPAMDVISVDNIWLGEYADNGWLLPLDDYYMKDKAEVNMPDFLQNVIYSISEWRGHLWTIPVAAYTQGVVYRVDVFNELGLKPPPKDPKDADWWTWDKYMEYVKAINGRTIKGTKYYGTCIAGVQPAPITHMYTQLAASKGVRWFKHFPEAPWDFTPNVNSPENVDALHTYVDLYKNSPPEAINYVWFDVGTQFGKGNIGMIYWWSPYFYLVNKAGYMTMEDSAVGKNGMMDPTKYDVGLLPQQPGVPQCYSVSAWSLAIPKFAPHPDEAWEFCKWATSAETQKKMGLFTEPSPYQFSDFSRASLYTDPDLLKIYPYLPTQWKEMNGWEGITAAGKYTRPGMPMYVTLEGIYGLQLNLAISEKTTPENALEITDKLWTNVLTENMYIPTYFRDSYDDTLANWLQTVKKFE